MKFKYVYPFKDWRPVTEKERQIETEREIKRGGEERQ